MEQKSNFQAFLDWCTKNDVLWYLFLIGCLVTICVTAPK